MFCCKIWWNGSFLLQIYFSFSFIIWECHFTVFRWWFPKTVHSTIFTVIKHFPVEFIAVFHCMWYGRFFYRSIYDTVSPPVGLCQLDTGSEADMEAAIDPLLCHYQGPVGSLLRRSPRYSPDLHDTFSGEWRRDRPVCVCVINPDLFFSRAACASEQRPVGATSSCSRKHEFYTCSSALEPYDHMMMQLGDTSCVEDCERGECVLGSSASYMGESEIDIIFSLHIYQTGNTSSNHENASK